MKLFICILTLFFFSFSVSAHNEDKPGPHGGHIQMPANFHVEAVADAHGGFHIYLMDMENKNPVTKDSWVKASVKDNKKTQKLKCSKMGEEHFQCTGKKITGGVLTVKAKRSGTEASMDATYELPLKPFTTAPPAPAVDHSQHH